MPVKPHPQRSVSFLFVLVGANLILLLWKKAEAFTFQHQPFHPRASKLGMYPSHHPQQQQMMTTSRSFQAAAAIDLDDVMEPYYFQGGLLSPQTVQRLDDRARGERINNSPLFFFLDTYKKYGPMACLPMLSDPQVLPHLTRALKESYGV